MGSISRFHLDRIHKDFKAPFFFETGTFRGDGVAYAAKTAFDRLLSVEIIPELAQTAATRFLHDKRVEVVTADSVTAFKRYLPNLDGNIVFWLDAHFPGADAGLTPYDKSGDEETRLPLPFEVATIRDLRPHSSDVIIIDDLRIYEDGPYENGNVPPDALPAGERNIRFVEEVFGATHYILRSYRDEGYLLVFPKKAYRKRHFRLANLFGRPVQTDDHYIIET